ncbi:MAG: geranylgeranylglyceryl/heptaprenylglyceryl phosphate synthase [Saprospirales bacterium]|nr:geranylgeranylglyceryl/heptaprenylglyceryl phosphate synthase [Saprospirales bacterium]MBK8489886.1 geranylgeranylglyceryl/heptaprenylglyceryl phosphate synthase [Saprospirales bacterium]
MSLLEKILKARRDGRKQLAILIDPDETDGPNLDRLVKMSVEAGVDFFFVGGSLLVKDGLEACLQAVRAQCDIPLILFPGSALQVSPLADGLLFLSLISGRNPELLIGQHVIAAPYVKKAGLEVLPTGYVLIDGGRPTTVSYMSQTAPIPADKAEIAATTALAGELLGLKLIYMDAGSGAMQAILPQMITAVRETISVPLIVGGGIRTPEQAVMAVKAGADLIVVGNVLEKEPGVLRGLVKAIKK